MNKKDSWIWLDDKLYPENITTVYSAFSSEKEKEKNGNYCVAEFKREYNFNKTVKCAKLTFSADTAFRLYLNGELLATGPAPVGGDFLFNDEARPSHYKMCIDIFPDTKKLDFFCAVKLMPVKIYEYSKGRGGFMLSGELTFSDETTEYISTDTSWLSRKNKSFVKPFVFDGEIKSDSFTPSNEVPDVWNAKAIPLSVLKETVIIPTKLTKNASTHDKAKTFTFELDKIYAGFLYVKNTSDKTLKLSAECYETAQGSGITEELTLLSGAEYRGFELHSAGFIYVKIKDFTDENCPIEIKFINTHYPVESESATFVSDKEINEVLSVCLHTLKQCRQLIHLDSPRHCEPLACTGDYYIESLMTAFSLGDMSLSKADILRTAELLDTHDGRMFHTTYSLIWVMMLYDVYMLTGDESLLFKCLSALKKLLLRFEAYIGENGLIETPPDYMFVDWIYVDGISLHHPPKALGQTCLNIYFYGMLKKASKIFGILKESALEERAEALRKSIKTAVNTHLYDKNRGLYFEGLNTPTPEKLLGEFMPQNVSKRYFACHANILAAAFGICDKKAASHLIDEVMTDKTLGDFQPYFAHFLFEAIFNNDLCEKYTLKLLERWKQPVKECPKGLVEGFLPPEPAYEFDHSHAWGGTPLYSLPKALSGIEVLEPGFKKIKLSPKLLGLSEAKVRIPTPYGEIKIDLKKGENPKYFIPKEITVVTE